MAEIVEKLGIVINATATAIIPPHPGVTAIKAAKKQQLHTMMSSIY